MKKYKYLKSNAFTLGNSLGNPAACIFMEKADLTDTQKQQIAREHKGFVMEMVFCEPSETVDCKLSYYSSECEVDFCIPLRGGITYWWWLLFEKCILCRAPTL